MSLEGKHTQRQMAIRRRRRFLCLVFVVFLLILGTICYGISKIIKNNNSKNNAGKEDTAATSSLSVDTDSDGDSDKEPNTDETEDVKPETNTGKPADKPVDDKVDETVDNTVDETAADNNSPADTSPDGELDPKYTNLMLINGKNPLPDTYDSEIREYLVEIDPQYRNNNYVTKIHKNIYPYITAMVKAAQEDGVDLRVWSPFRSYADQKALFDRQVERAGGNEELAATVVAKPGTSEHNSGICADFNMADDAFEQTEMYKWMCKNAENYGFILRYPKDKQDKTGVIYESWHWRFVGIEAAKKINKTGLCLEEYLEKNNIKQKIPVDGF